MSFRCGPAYPENGSCQREVTLEGSATTAAVQLHLLRKATHLVLEPLNASAWWVEGLQILDLGGSLKLDGLRLGCCEDVLRSGGSLLQHYSAWTSPVPSRPRTWTSHRAAAAVRAPLPLISSTSKILTSLELPSHI